MQIVVIGGTGLIGAKVVRRLTGHGHTAIVASPSSGVNTLTGDGLAAALDGADVVVDVSNAPSFADQAVLEFFRTSTANILAAAAAAGVGHLVALSVVGAQRLAESGYFRAKIVQEELIGAGELAYSIVQATQFFEFVGAIADAATVDGTVRLAPAPFQPIAAADVAAAVGVTAASVPVLGTVEVAGPQRFRLDELVRQHLAGRGDPRLVVTDPQARYFGAPLDEHTLIPRPDALFARTRFEDWQAVTGTTVGR
ncbi:SDR family oxidoreductase [Frankia sp. AiPs1]|uniref:SDR family oxidoreductase n=1 Tax=Frankia sp. AiPs1 TaxID=573493 RepID=UPI002043C73B|nr:SDR family oxidoreductase [Frankia sp. AiPs1]MCM3925864.1 SDR family oxidoreductase [Frankia sp. AiPs1]